MRTEHKFGNLKANILQLSEADDFEAAKKEWVLIGAEISSENDCCLCGQEIREHCHIRNELNGNATYVCNDCCKWCMGINTGRLFRGLKRIGKEARTVISDDVVFFTKKFGYLYDNEYDFLVNTRGIKVPSQNQLDWMEKINRKIVRLTVVQRRGNS